MHSRLKYVSQMTLVSLVLILPSFLCADTMYTYTSSNGVDVSFDLTTIDPDNIPPGTNVSIDIGSFSMIYPAPSEDNAGFLLGDNIFNVIPPTVEIGTNSLGDITSWDITATQFATYPAPPDPTVFSCDYAVTFNDHSDISSLLAIDNDAGFCPSPTAALPASGSWSAYTVPVSTTPEPRNSALVGGGLLGLVVLATRRKRAAIAR
jgi:hypothetical protein